MFLESTSNIQIRVREAPKKHFLRFIRNSAQRGKGVYVEDNDQPLCREGRGKELSKHCFLHTFILRKKTPFHLIVFELSSAADTGSDIFGGLLDRCADSIVTQSSASRHSGIEYIQKNVHFDWANNSKVTDTTDLYGHISSDPVRVCHCAKEGTDCNITQPQVFSKKGERFTLSLIALDQVGRPLNATIISSLVIADGAIEGLGKGQERRTIGGHCTELEYNVYSAQSEVAMKVFSDGPCGDQGISKQDVGITFLPCTCPTGLEIGSNVMRCSCECDRRLASFVSNCSQEKPHRLLHRAHGAISRCPHYQRVPSTDQEDLSEEDNDCGQREHDEQLIALAEVQNDTDSDNPDCYITPPIIRGAVPGDQLREPALDILIPVQPEDYNTH